MKTLLYQSLLIFSLCAIGSCIALREEIYTVGEEIDCTAIGGTVPIPIFNSPYTILPNGSLCCPKYIGDFCEDEKVIAGDKCRGRGLVHEPCHFCKTCAKLAGEPCGGHQNLYGTCDEGLECVEADQNSTHGICYGKADKQIGEVCGGPYGIRGRCLQDLSCTVDSAEFLTGNDVQGICLNESIVPGACFKDCSTRKPKSVCGNDGRIYANSCELRKQNCLIPEGRQPDKIKTAPSSICNQACGDVDLSNYRNAIVSSYSYGVVNGSEATVVCKEGYDVVPNNEPITLQCIDRQWLRVITNEDGSEERKSSWRVLCYPSPQSALTSSDTSSNDQ